MSARLCISRNQDRGLVDEDPKNDNEWRQINPEAIAPPSLIPGIDEDDIAYKIEDIRKF